MPSDSPWVKKVIGQEAEIIERDEEDGAEFEAWRFLSIYSHETTSGIAFSSGYVQLSFVNAFLFDSGNLSLPNLCVICGEAASTEDPELIRKERGFFGPRSQGVCEIESGRKCETHSELGYPGVHVRYCVEKPGVAWLSCSVQSKSYLQSFLRELHAGQHLPPWVVCPGLGPYVGWTSGSQHEWLHHGWLPFWEQLNRPDQIEYIKRWRAPLVWREFFNERYGIPESA